MARKRTSAGGPRLRIAAGGGRTRNLDCCCDECTATTGEAVTQYIQDQGFLGRLVITTDDYSESCDCSALAATYDLPFLARTHLGTGVWQVQFSDSFSVTTCGNTKTISVNVQFRVGPTLAVIVVATVFHGIGTVDLKHQNSWGAEPCPTIISTTYNLSPLFDGSANAQCETLGGEGDAQFSLV